MTAGQRDLQTTPCLELTADLAEVGHRRSARSHRLDDPLTDRLPARVDQLDPARCGHAATSAPSANHLDSLVKGLDAGNLHPIHETRFVDGGGRHDDPSQTSAGEGGDHGQDARHGANLATERQLADHGDPPAA